MIYYASWCFVKLVYFSLYDFVLAIYKNIFRYFSIIERPPQRERLVKNNPGVLYRPTYASALGSYVRTFHLPNQILTITSPLPATSILDIPRWAFVSSWVEMFSCLWWAFCCAPDGVRIDDTIPGFLFTLESPDSSSISCGFAFDSWAHNWLLVKFYLGCIRRI
jgi:hypothetical protein